MRLLYLTTCLRQLKKARVLADPYGCVVAVRDPDAPPPQPCEADGMIVDLDRAARHRSARATLLESLAHLARTVPVVVHDLGLHWTEAKALLAAGVKTYPTLRPKLVADLAARAGLPFARPVIDLAMMAEEDEMPISQSPFEAEAETVSEPS